MLVIYYRSSWNPCFIHAPVQSHWSSHPMIRHPQRRKWVMITFDEFFTDFVFTNGSKWDNPGPNLNYKLTRPGSYAVYHGKLIEIIPSKKPVLLVADLDNTLVGSYQPTRDALARFNEYWIKSHYFTGSRLVYNTGRSLEEFLVLYSEGHPLLDPDLLVTAVGSDVYTVNQETGDYQLQTAYYDLFDRNHWDSEIMDRVIREEFPWLVVPDTRHIYPFKTWMKAKTEDIYKNLLEVKRFVKNAEAINRHGKVIQGKIIVSGLGDWRFIDFTPLEGGKSMGVKYAKMIFNFEDSDVMAAGDSGNDIDMLKGPYWGIVVANYEESLGMWLRKKDRKHLILAERMFADAIIECIEKIHNDY